MTSLLPRRTDKGTRLAARAMMAFVAAALMSCSGPPAPEAGYAPSAERGQALALTICNACHQVSATRPSTSEDSGVSFVEVAHRPGMNGTELMQLLTEWHSLERFDLPQESMPTFMLNRAEREDIVRYILSLGSSPEAAEGRAD
jgi:mono/diheme cytochrome c family protein